MKFSQPDHIKIIFDNWRTLPKSADTTVDLLQQTRTVETIFAQIESDAHSILGWAELEVNERDVSVEMGEFFDRLASSLKTKMTDMGNCVTAIHGCFIKLRHLYNDVALLEHKITTQTTTVAIHNQFTDIRKTQLEHEIVSNIAHFYSFLTRLVNLVDMHIQVWQPKTKTKSGMHG